MALQLKPAVRVYLAALAAVFGLLTIMSGGKVLFGPQMARIAAGHYVPFVLWFNFLAGFAYLLCALGIWKARGWSRPLAWGIALATLAVFAIFGLLIATGTPFEPRTVGAMTLRSLVWLAIALILHRAAGRAAS